jgi:hypothetical protein
VFRWHSLRIASSSIESWNAFRGSRPLALEGAVISCVDDLAAKSPRVIVEIDVHDIPHMLTEQPWSKVRQKGKVERRGAAQSAARVP